MTTTSGYEALLAAGLSLTGTAVLDSDSEPSEREIAEFLNANGEALERARQALQREYAVRLGFTQSFFERQTENYPPLRHLARAFSLELKTAKRCGDYSRAVTTGLDIFHLANAVRHGGLIVDLLVAIAIEGIGMEGTRGIRRNLEPDDATRLVNELCRIDAQREPFDHVYARDKKWEEAVDDPGQEAELANAGWPQDDDGKIDEALKQVVAAMVSWYNDQSDDEKFAFQKRLDDRNLALVRLLAIETALICHHARSGKYPPTLSGLVPGYMVTVPPDPFSGAEFLYRRVKDGFVVYSPGPTGHDWGGTFGGWMSVLSGEADLGIDMYDYQNR